MKLMCAVYPISRSERQTDAASVIENLSSKNVRTADMMTSSFYC